MKPSMKPFFSNCLGALTLACIFPALSATLDAQSITTTFASNNGAATGAGNFFDITVLGRSLHITKFDINSGGLVNKAVTIDVYVTSKTYVGKDANAALWMKVATGSGKSLGPDKATPIDTTDFVLAAGSYGMAIFYGGAGMRYTDGTSTNNSYKNTAVALKLGVARSALFGGLQFSPRIWNGTIYYDTLNAAFYGTYGIGCKGSAGFPTLAPAAGSNLKLGASFTINLSNLPLKEKLSVIMGGFRSNSFAGLSIIPFDIKGLGAPGCRLLMDPLGFQGLLNTAGKAQFVTAFPNNTAFMGIPIYHQAMVFDKAANAIGLTLTNAGGGVLGK